MTSFFKALICAIFGECHKVQEAHAEIRDLQRRVNRLERDTRREQSSRYWRPSDAFRTR